MHKKLPLLLTGSLAGVALLINSLSAADSPAAAPAPAAASASAAPAAPAPAAAPAASTAPKADMSKVPAASDKKDLTFDKDIAPILKASCTTCHAPNNGRAARANLDLSTKEGVLKGGKSKGDLVVGHGDQSNVLLYASDAVATHEMPPASARTRTPPVSALTKDQLADLRAWIDQGAK